ncbi:MAG: Hsp20/alpha crystallin family protein [Desulfobacterota bacterium]|nr:Hsp20/alpha crystallin family protein [Thermodesulfobacteriota bacterium]
MAIRERSTGAELMFLQDRMNRVFDESLRDSVLSRNPGHFVPHVDIYEDDASITVMVELPGVRRDEITLDITDGVLTISGRKPFDPGDAAESFHVVERQYGLFKRSFNLPEAIDLDRIEANHHAGVLEVILPKPVLIGSRRIPIIREDE